MNDSDTPNEPSGGSDLPFTRRDAFALLAALGAAGLGDIAQAQDATRVNPRAYRTVFENERVRVLDIVSRPGIGVCGAGKHSHPAHLTIALTPVKAKVTLADGRVIVAENQPGDVFWEEASTHVVENVGGSGARIVLVELKDANWKPSTGA